MEKHDGHFHFWVNYTFKAIFKTPCDENQVFNVVTVAILFHCMENMMDIFISG